MAKDEEEQSSRGFKVEDRRRFVDDAAPAPDPEPAAAAAPPPPDPAAHDHADHDEDPTAHGGAHQHQEINFTTFVMGLSTQALMHLGEIVEPGAPNTPDLPAAKQMIDLL